MKNSFVYIIVLLCVLIIGGIVFLGGAMHQPIQDAQDLDLLNSANLVSAINVERTKEGKESLIQNETLNKKAEDLSHSFSNGIQPSEGWAIRFEKLHGNYYSVSDFLEQYYSQIPSPANALIGVWVTYYADKPDAKPVAYVVILIK